MQHVACAFSTLGVQNVIPNGCWSMTEYTNMYVYVSLLCIPISFFTHMRHCWSNKRHIIFMGMKKASKRNLDIFMLRVFDHLQWVKTLTNNM